jgi:hypothetical protein
MVDLKELERRLDEALANETKDSLNDWLNSQRIDSIEVFLEECIIDSLPSKPVSFSLDLPVKNHFSKQNDNVAAESNYDLAA